MGTQQLGPSWKPLGFSIQKIEARWTNHQPIFNPCPFWNCDPCEFFCKMSGHIKTLPSWKRKSHLSAQRWSGLRLLLQAFQVPTARTGVNHLQRRHHERSYIAYWFPTFPRVKCTSNSILSVHAKGCDLGLQPASIACPRAKTNAIHEPVLANQANMTKHSQECIFFWFASHSAGHVCAKRMRRPPHISDFKTAWLFCCPGAVTLWVASHGVIHHGQGFGSLNEFLNLYSQSTQPKVQWSSLTLARLFPTKTY